MESKETHKITIELIKPEEFYEVYVFALEYFFKDEPLCNSLELTYCKDNMEYLKPCIADYCSYKAVNQNGEIVGVVISVLQKRPCPGENQPKKIIENLKWRKVYGLKSYTEQFWNIFDMFPNADVIVNGRIVAVDTKYRGYGIGRKLIERTVQFMKENNIPVMKRWCSSIYSAKIMQSFGMTEVHKLYYRDYKINGDIAFKLKEPHDACRSFVLEVKKI